MAPQDDPAPPSAALGAVLMASASMPEGARKVEELDFNKFKGRPITAEDLYHGMKNMGFQASSIGEAIRIINEMVSSTNASGKTRAGRRTLTKCSEHGETPRPVTKLQSFSGIRPT